MTVEKVSTKTVAPAKTAPAAKPQQQCKQENTGTIWDKEKGTVKFKQGDNVSKFAQEHSAEIRKQMGLDEKDECGKYKISFQDMYTKWAKSMGIDDPNKIQAGKEYKAQKPETNCPPETEQKETPEAEEKKQCTPETAQKAQESDNPYARKDDTPKDYGNGNGAGSDPAKPQSKCPPEAEEPSGKKHRTPEQKADSPKKRSDAIGKQAVETAQKAQSTCSADTKSAPETRVPDDEHKKPAETPKPAEPTKPEEKPAETPKPAT